MQEVKHLFFDIETLANLIWSWDKYKNKNWSAIATEADWYPFSFGFKWKGDKKVQYRALNHYKGYKPQIQRFKDGSFKVNPVNTLPLLQDLHALWEEAHIVSGWNSDRYDIDRMHMLMIEAGLPPVDFIKFDVMKEKKKLGYSDSNSLANTSKQFGVGEKMSNDGWPLWIGCAEGDPKSLKIMEKYCKIDVQRTEDIYNFIRPHIKKHPNLAVITNKPEACPSCGVVGQLIGHGTRVTKTGTYQRYLCQNCGAAPSERVKIKFKARYN